MHGPGKGVDTSDTNPEHEPGSEKVVMVRHQVEGVVRTRRRDRDLARNTHRRRSTQNAPTPDALSRIVTEPLSSYVAMRSQCASA